MSARFRRGSIGTAVAALVLYAAAAALLYGVQRRVIFPGQGIDVRDQAPPAVAGLEALEIDSAAGITEAWYLPPLAGAPRPAPALVFAHGNGEVIDWWAEQLDDFRRWGMAVLVGP